MQNDELICKIHNKKIIGHVQLAGHRIGNACQECFDYMDKLKKELKDKILPCKKCGSYPTFFMTLFLYYCKKCDPKMTLDIYPKDAPIKEPADIAWNTRNQKEDDNEK